MSKFVLAIVLTCILGCGDGGPQTFNVQGTVKSKDKPLETVPVHDVGSMENCPCYIVSKYIPGTDLATKIKQYRLKYREAAEIVATVAEALHYAHKQGLVHRDVKPGNILIDKDDNPYVVDFGLALREENIGKGPKYAGTPARDKSLVEPLLEELLTNKVVYIAPIRQQLRPYAGELTEKLRAILLDDKAEANRRFRAATTLATAGRRFGIGTIPRFATASAASA